MVLNRQEAAMGRHGVDSTGIDWTEIGPIHANVGTAKGKTALNVGALDAYAVRLVRMRWHPAINERSRIKFGGKTFQILPDTFWSDRRADEIQFTMQTLVND